MDDQTLHQIKIAVQEAFSAGVDDKRYIDITRIPLICQSIIRIDANLEDMKNNLVTQEAFWPVKTIVFGLVGIILVSVATAIVMLVIKQ